MKQPDGDAHRLLYGEVGDGPPAPSPPRPASAALREDLASCARCVPYTPPRASTAPPQDCARCLPYTPPQTPNTPPQTPYSPPQIPSCARWLPYTQRQHVIGCRNCVRSDGDLTGRRSLSALWMWTRWESAHARSHETCALHRKRNTRVCSTCFDVSCPDCPLPDHGFNLRPQRPPPDTLRDAQLATVRVSQELLAFSHDLAAERRALVSATTPRYSRVVSALVRRIPRVGSAWRRHVQRRTTRTTTEIDELRREVRRLDGAAGTALRDLIACEVGAFDSSLGETERGDDNLGAFDSRRGENNVGAFGTELLASLLKTTEDLRKKAWALRHRHAFPGDELPVRTSTAALKRSDRCWSELALQGAPAVGATSGETSGRRGSPGGGLFAFRKRSLRRPFFSRVSGATGSTRGRHALRPRDSALRRLDATRRVTLRL